MAVCADREVLGVEVHRDHPAHDGGVDELQAVAPGRPEDGQRPGPKRRDDAPERRGERRRLADRRQGHVRLVVGDRDAKPRMIHLLTPDQPDGAGRGKSVIGACRQRLNRCGPRSSP